MDALELFLLGRKLMKIGEQAVPARAGYHQLPASVRSVMIDVFEHPGSAIRDICARTGFPQSHVSAAVARLRDHGVIVTATDPDDRRRTRVEPAPQIARQAQRLASAPINDALAAAIGTAEPQQIAQIVSALETLARYLIPKT